MTTIAELRKRKKKWLEDTLSANQLKKELKLSRNEIDKIKPETKCGKTRYQKNEVSWFLKINKQD
ncbi:hypothetical protein HY604_03795 [Candidatus Peregrinibacteria bacterium]|nr:hypothetical protein [Candidatus Peregrinibacteria bacterium]